MCRLLCLIFYAESCSYSPTFKVPSSLFSHNYAFECVRVARQVTFIVRDLLLVEIILAFFTCSRNYFTCRGSRMRVSHACFDARTCLRAFCRRGQHKDARDFRWWSVSAPDTTSAASRTRERNEHISPFTESNRVVTITQFT